MGGPLGPGPRLLVFSGHPGAGTTTLAAAAALRCSRSGRRTLLVPFHDGPSLGEVLAVELPAGRHEIGDGLWVDVDTAGRGSAAPDPATVAVERLEGLLAERPGSDRRAGGWDTIVVGGPPPAEWVSVLEQVAHERGGPTAGPGGATLDPARTRFRLVVAPERRTIGPLIRGAAALSLLGATVDGVVVNGVLPPGEIDGWFDEWRAVQDDCLRRLDAELTPLRATRSPLHPRPVSGLDALERLGGEVWGVDDPAAFDDRGPSVIIRRVDRGYELVLAVPFGRSDELRLARRRAALVVGVGTVERTLALPDSLQRRHVVGAVLEGGALTVRFDDPPPA